MSRYIIFAFAAATIIGIALIAHTYIGFGPNPNAQTAPSEPNLIPHLALRLGIIPERNVYQQRTAYRLLGDYLQTKDLGLPIHTTVDILTASSYSSALKDMEEGQLDAAFVGSLVAALAYERCGAEVVLKSEELDGRSMYAGVVFVRESSPARTFNDLMGKRIGGVKTTTAGAVYPLYLIRKLGWQALDVPTLVWSGTHEDVINEVLLGSVDAGAVKDLRFDAYMKEHPEAQLRTLSLSGRVPNNALVLRKGLPAAQKEKLPAALLAMESDPAAVPALAALGYKRFVCSDIKEYGPLYDMIEAIGPAWFALDVGPAPHRPALTSAEGGRK